VEGVEMTTKSIHQILEQETQALSDDLLAEVLDFVQFLKSRQAEEAFLWEQVEETQAFRRRHPEEILTVTAEEWMALTSDPGDGA
jgi:hypothetical protein